MSAFLDAIGLVAACLSTFAFLPQVVETWRARSAGGLSLAMLVVLTAGATLWLVYGVGTGQRPVILANVATLGLLAVLLALKLRDLLRARGCSAE